jgi:hypothetical protein
MGSTQFRGYPRVDPLAVPNGRGQVNALADAVDADVQLLSTGYRLAAVVQFTSSGSFTKGSYAGLRAIEVEVIGGGGGSAFAAATNGSQTSFGTGGGGGGYGHGFILAGSLASTETVTVGAGGAGGTSGVPDGTDGGNSSFGAHVTAGGGGHGSDSGTISTAAGGGSFLAGAPGATGAGTAIDIGVPGEGESSVDILVGGFLSYVEGLRGHRSGGPYGAAVHPIIGGNTSSAGNQGSSPGVGVGGGARGPRNLTSSSSSNGAAGSAGRVIVRVYV